MNSPLDLEDADHIKEGKYQLLSGSVICKQCSRTINNEAECDKPDCLAVKFLKASTEGSPNEG